MAKVEDCPGFETFGADVKAARKAKHLTRKVLAEIVEGVIDGAIKLKDEEDT